MMKFIDIAITFEKIGKITGNGAFFPYFRMNKSIHSFKVSLMFGIGQAGIPIVQEIETHLFYSQEHVGLWLSNNMPPGTAVLGPRGPQILEIGKFLKIISHPPTLNPSKFIKIKNYGS